MRRLILIMISSITMVGCTPYNMINSIAAIGRPPTGQIDINELYWDPQEISSQGCPAIDGMYLAPLNSFLGLGAILPLRLIDREKEIPQTRSSVFSLRHTEKGVFIRGRNTLNDRSGLMTFDDKFGCGKGFFVSRSYPRYTGGADSFSCTGVGRTEYRWKLDDKKNLVATRIERNSCWIERSKRIPEKEKVFINIYERIGEASDLPSDENAPVLVKKNLWPGR